jgi:hypothetical protein
LVTQADAQAVIDRYKVLATDMAWTSKRGKKEWGWLSARMSIQFADEFAISDEVWVVCQWRDKGKRIPEHWTYSLFYKEERIYAIDIQPTSIHENDKAGKGRPYWDQEIDGIHEHLWDDGGYGYAEPIEAPLGQPDVVWKMFLSRANIDPGGEFVHPDQNQPGLL